MTLTTPNSPATPRKKPGPKPKANGSGVSKAIKPATGAGALNKDAVFMYRVYRNGGPANWTVLAKQCGISPSTAMRWFNRIKAGVEELEAKEATKREDDGSSSEKEPVNKKPKKSAKKKTEEKANMVTENGSEELVNESEPEKKIQIKKEPEEQDFFLVKGHEESDMKAAIKSEEDTKSESEDGVKSEDGSE